MHVHLHSPVLTFFLYILYHKFSIHPDHTDSSSLPDLSNLFVTIPETAEEATPPTAATFSPTFLLSEPLLDLDLSVRGHGSRILSPEFMEVGEEAARSAGNLLRDRDADPPQRSGVPGSAELVYK